MSHDLFEAARSAMARAYAPYSKFPVGAALQLRDGRVFHGCNVENASYGLAVCAERNAMWRAVCEGERDFAAMAVTAREGQGAPPCGSCRQVLHEFAPDLWIYWRDRGGRILKRRLAQLLPMAFTIDSLKRR